MSLFRFPHGVIAVALLLSMSGRSHLATSASAQESQRSTPQELIAQANAKEKVGNWAEAASLWEKVVALNPSMPYYWNQMGKAYKQAGSYRKAITAFTKSLEMSWGYPWATAYEIAACYAKAGDEEQALQWIETSLSLGLRSLQACSRTSSLSRYAKTLDSSGSRRSQTLA